MGKDGRDGRRSREADALPRVGMVAQEEGRERQQERGLTAAAAEKTTSMASEGSALHCLSWIESDKPSYVSTIIPFKIHL